MMDFYNEYAVIVQTWVFGVYIVSKLCLYVWCNVFKLIGMNWSVNWSVNWAWLLVLSA